MTLEETREQFAIEKGYKDWDDLFNDLGKFPKSIDTIGKRIAKRYSKAKLEEAAEKATARIIVKSAGPLGIEEMAVVDKQSITNIPLD